MSFYEKIFSAPNTKKEFRIINENETLLGRGDNKQESEKNKQLRSGFEAILQTLQKDPEVLKQKIERLKSLPDYDGILGKLSPFLSEVHWEMLTVLESYDTTTFNHSLRVTNFVHTIATGSGATEAYLESRIATEKSSFEKLYTASLFHDIGKTAIPKHILHDDHSRREWGKRANIWAETHGNAHHFNQQKLETLDEVELDNYFMQIHTISKSDPLNIVPIETFFDESDLLLLREHGISPHDTFRKVLECHEKATNAILLSRKIMYIAADIASHHHDYERKPIQLEHYKTETSALRLGFELSLLRSMDVFDALTSSDRSYKTPYHPLLALEILIKEAEAEFTEQELTKHVVSDLYAMLKTEGQDIPTTESEKQARIKILRFID
ncbi:MAG: HD domain-containing protein [Candidatus Moranbacteria bacterium]|nr:HD domain-containing protein [Candidatus Moranbacteria bacterium]OIQ04039.1 MAG: hypothetical protein AUK58_01190 [Candidatus Moranbacteria bacterium CG2_30_41_165]PIP25268.1 MAG: hypothetical protein COX32_04690 [Candidatus Moranbacteria bacterium CG23_combo_of_CG06-09_8_20_14_all_41_28]PIV86284.1 MAG: hypothetical protein COW50_02330 [Candidatus Moranbacteria bacterium CG17_big_fil_post_rev_8_21_14_2_50_41_107]PIW94489.1 MAG: hypothetical protein COZ86_00845 [Candidatus Moranbacteria bacte